MLAYIARRLLLAVLTVWAISVLSFMIIHLPPGDYVTSYIASMSASGSAVSEGEAQALREQLGLDKPITVQYAKWMGLILQGNFGMAMEWGRPVADVIGDRLTLTMVISVAAIIFTWGLALPIGIYSAVYPYSFLDYAFTFIGFIGLAIPGFLLALVVMYVGFAWFGANVGGLFSPDFAEAPWSMEKVWDLTKHLPIPAIVLGVAGTAQLIRIMRSNLLDELRKPYVMTARARGLSEYRVIMRYPVRVALNPFVSTIGYLLPYVVSGSIIVSLVLSLPTVGPLLLEGVDRPGYVPGRNHHPAAGGHDRHRHVHFGPAADVGRPQNPVWEGVMAELAAVRGARSGGRRRRPDRRRHAMAAHLVALQEAQARRGRDHRPGCFLSGCAVRRLFRLCGSDGIGSPEIADGAAADSLDRRGKLQTLCVCVERERATRSRSSGSMFPIRAPRYRSHSSATESLGNCSASSPATAI